MEANAQRKYYLFCFTAAAGHGRIIQMPISSGVCTRRWHSVTADATLSSRSSRVLLLVERRMRGPKASASARVSTPCFELLRENLHEGIRSEGVVGVGEEKKEEEEGGKLAMLVDAAAKHEETLQQQRTDAKSS